MGKKVEDYYFQPEDEIRMMTIRQRLAATESHDPATAKTGYFNDMLYLLAEIDRLEAELARLKAEPAKRYIR